MPLPKDKQGLEREKRSDTQVLKWEEPSFFQRTERKTVVVESRSKRPMLVEEEGTRPYRALETQSSDLWFFPVGAQRKGVGKLSQTKEMK